MNSAITKMIRGNLKLQKSSINENKFCFQTFSSINECFLQFQTLRQVPEFDIIEREDGVTMEEAAGTISSMDIFNPKKSRLW